MVTDARHLVALYASGLFPMDEPGAPELPWWSADPRAVFELDEAARARTRRAVRRSLRAAGEDWDLRADGAFGEVLAACARPRGPDDGVWLTPRLAAVYRVLHSVGAAHTLELWASDRLMAGIVAVTVGRAAMLESMFHRVSHAGNAALVRALDALADHGYELCDVQLPTEHTTRLGAIQIRASEYERRLARAVAGPRPPWP